MIEDIKIPNPNLEIIIGSITLHIEDKKTIVTRIKYKIMEVCFPMKITWLE